jgi:hypothetical protein
MVINCTPLTNNRVYEIWKKIDAHYEWWRELDQVLKSKICDFKDPSDSWPQALMAHLPEVGPKQLTSLAVQQSVHWQQKRM